MKILELFCGTKSFANVAKERGHECVTIDVEQKFNPTFQWNLLCKNNQKLVKELIMDFDLIWMSPPCTTFSMASGNKHWTKERKTKTLFAEKGLQLINFCKNIAEDCLIYNKLFVIENPRARARWFLPEEWRDTAWYCQYGHPNAKPTDLWHNIPGLKLKTCHNGNKECHHQPAPRGSRTGTQGLKGAEKRSIVPKELCEEILDCCT